MKAKKKIIVFAVLVLIVAFTGLSVSETFSRYVSEENGSAETTLAKWNVSFSGNVKDKTFSTIKMVVRLIPEANPYVIDGVFAPGSDATGWIDIDLTGTEVAVDLTFAPGDIVMHNVDNFDNTAMLTHFAIPKVTIYDANDIDEDGNVISGATPIGSTGSSNEKVLIGLNSDRTALAHTKLKAKVSISWYEDVDDIWDTVMGEIVKRNGNSNGETPVLDVDFDIKAQQHLLSDD